MKKVFLIFMIFSCLIFAQTTKLNQSQVTGLPDSLAAINSRKANLASPIFTGMLSDTSGSLWFNGTSGNVPTSGMGTRMMWIPSLSAFRAGFVSGTNWDAANIGYYSFAVGLNTTANNYYSFAGGQNTTASGNSSTAFGSGTLASGNSSTAFGSGTTASGDYSAAYGYNTTASSLYSMVMGNYSSNSGAGSLSIGGYNLNASSNNLIAGLKDSILSTANLNFILGENNKVNTNKYGNWMFGQFLNSNSNGLWVLGSDNSFTKKIIPYHDQVVFYNEPTVVSISDVNSVSTLPSRASMSFQNLNTTDSTLYQFAIQKVGSGFSNFGLWGFSNFSNDGNSGLNSAYYRRYINIDNTSGNHDIIFNDSKTDLGAWGSVTIANGRFKVPNSLTVLDTLNLTVSLDTAYTNAVSKINSGNGIIATKNAKDYSLKIDTTIKASASLTGFLSYSDYNKFNVGIKPLSAPSANYSILPTDYYLDCTGGSSGITVTLPTAVGVTGKTYVITKVDAGVGYVTIATTSSQTISGSATYQLLMQYVSVTLHSNGSNWILN